QARFLYQVMADARRAGYRVNVIEAFDQPWKRQLEGTVGGHWGLFDAYRRTAKFKWGEPVSNHPGWRWQAVGGAALALLVFGVAAAVARRRGIEAAPDRWLGVAGGAPAARAPVGRGRGHLPGESPGAPGG